MVTIVTVDDFLRKGYFLKELPPLFSTSNFANIAATWELSSFNTNDHASLVRYSHSKFASTRRQLSIPNPYQFHQLSTVLSQHWNEMHTQIWSASPYSLSVPIPSSSRAVQGTLNLRDLPLERARVRAAGRYIFRTDIASFYPSIYTHSIPWAIHGKAVAKANYGNTLWGNIADTWSRNMQDRQTIGLPIGPDTSFVLAETILCAVDKLLNEKLEPLAADILGFRFIDDFEFVCASQPQAEEVLAHLQEVLSQFELNLNAQKTSIYELPQALDTPWIDELENFSLDTNSRLTRYFTRAFELARIHPGEPVLKYAVSRLDGLEVHQYSDQLFQHLLLQVSVADPGTLQFTLRQLYLLHNENANNTDTISLSRALNLLIQRHSPLGHGSEVAWCIWATVVFGVTLSSASSQAIAKMEDNIVALTAMFCEQHNVFSESLDKTVWQSIVHNNSSTKEHWLLIYEAVAKGWLNAPHSGDLNDAPQYIKNLRDANVEFIDLNTTQDIPNHQSSVNY